MPRAPISSDSPADRIRRECFGLPLRMLHRTVSAIYDEALAAHGLGIAQLNLLVAVESMNKGTGRATPSMVSRGLMLEKSSVSREVERLVERGWILRAESADGRSQELSVSAQGRRIIEAALPSWEMAQARVRVLLGEAGAEVLGSMAERLRASERG